MRAILLALLGGLGIAAVPGGADGAGDYRFAPGDVLEVTVTPQRDFGRTVTIQPDGKISYPVVGQMQAAGLTVDQFVAALRTGLGRELVEPEITVSLKEISRQAAPRVSLLGAVRNPGVFEITDGSTLAEVLAKAGGPTLLADLRQVVVTRPDRSVVTVDLAAVGKAGTLEPNVALRPGDLIVVPEGAAPTVLVLGEVGRPGSVPLQGETRLLDALSQAGGPTTKADLRRVTLARPGTAGERTLDLQPLLAGKETANPEVNPVLRPGDTIVLGETAEQVYVLGRVARPDIYPIKPNDRVLDIFTRAGGAAPDGDITRAVLVRRGDDGQPVPRKLDLKKVMETGNRAANDLLRPGDALFIPDKKQRHPVDPLNLLYPLTSFINLFR
jgi:polysaccharide export outer membrane protein